MSTFRELHRTGCFVIPNPWDAGSARYLARAGFQALATTSAGYAFSMGLPDGEGAVSRDATLAHVDTIVRATNLPVNADFQSGFGDTPEQVAESVQLCARTGVAGLSIEDVTGDAARPLYELDEAVERVRAARGAIDGTGLDVLLTARAECFLVGEPNPLRESIRRLQAYAEAGADVLYAPGPTDRNELRTIITELSPMPVNVLVRANSGLTVSQLAGMGARRVSVGSGLALAAWDGFVKAVKLIADEGSFAGLDGKVSYSEINSAF